MLSSRQRVAGIDVMARSNACSLGTALKQNSNNQNNHSSPESNLHVLATKKIKSTACVGQSNCWWQIAQQPQPVL